MPPKRVELVYEMDRDREDWGLTEDQVPESSPHDLVSDRIQGLLRGWAARAARRVKIGRNLAIRWIEERPSIGVDPDVYMLEPPPPDGDEILSLKLWEPGHVPPILAVEVVSESRASKDYGASPEKYAACGALELWVLDPKLCGPKARGGPVRIQVWRRGEDGRFRRVYAGEGPVLSLAVGGWLFVVDEGRSFRLADDEEGTSWWMTPEEAERAAKEAALRREREERDAKDAALRREREERDAKDAALRREREERDAKEGERAAKEAALKRVAELEAMLAAQGRGTT